MRSLARRLAVSSLLLASAAVPHTAGAQQKPLSRVAYDSPKGRVEVLGLRRWTLRMLEDSVRSRVRGLSLHDAACMVVLRDSLKFADALVQDMVIDTAPGAPPQRFLVIKLVEPRDSARVQWNRARRDTFNVLRPAFAEVVLPATDSAGNLWLGRLLWPLQFYGDSALRSWAFEVKPDARADARRLWDFLSAHRNDADWRTALHALRRDGSYANRLVAAAVLANFPERDSTWIALVEALRDPNDAVRSAAVTVLRGLPPRTVEWTPAVPTLRHLLAGTNVGATTEVLQLLVRTNVSPALAGPLLRRNAEWTLAHLGAEHPGAAAAARALLVRLNAGRDLGAQAGPWARWAGGL